MHVIYVTQASVSAQLTICICTRVLSHLRADQRCSQSGPRWAREERFLILRVLFSYIFPYVLPQFGRGGSAIQEDVPIWSANATNAEKERKSLTSLNYLVQSM